MNTYNAILIPIKLAMKFQHTINKQINIIIMIKFDIHIFDDIKIFTYIILYWLEMYGLWEGFIYFIV